MTNAALRGKPYAGNPHVAPSQCYGGTRRFDEGEVALAATPRRGSLLYRTVMMMLGAAALLPLHADTYQFIVSGYPAANVSYSAASSGTSLEARYRTWDESDGIALRSDKFCGMMLILR